MFNPYYPEGADENLKRNIRYLRAALDGKADMVEYYLNDGADIDFLNNTDPNATKGNTALFYAAAKRYTKIVKLLLDRGANSKIKNRDDETALSAAAIRGYNNIVRLILDKEDAIAREKRRVRKEERAKKK